MKRVVKKNAVFDDAIEMDRDVFHAFSQWHRSNHLCVSLDLRNGELCDDEDRC